MKQHINMELLKQVDEATEERIAEEFPINLEKEERFERAYQNYLEKSQERDTSAATIKHYRMRFVSAVACCVLILGAAYAFRIPEHQISTMPDETVTETNTGIPLSESTLDPMTEESSEPESSQFQMNEYTSITESGSTSVIRPTSTEPVITDATVLQTSTKETSELLTSKATEPPVIIDTEPIITDMTEMVSTQVNTRTQPTGSSAVEISDPIQQPVTEPLQPKQPTTTEQLETAISTQVPATETHESTESTEAELLPGFDVIDHDDSLEIIYREKVVPSSEQILVYSLDSEEFELTNTRIPEEVTPTSIRYEVRLPEHDLYFTVQQKKRDHFSYFCESDTMLYPAQINDYPGFWAVSQDESCILYWDDGRYTFSIFGTLQDQEVMRRIAEAFTGNAVESISDTSEGV